MPQLVVNLAEGRRFMCRHQPAAFGAKFEDFTRDAISLRRK
jgi:hypothetical protein